MVIKRRTIAASSLREGMLVDFEDGEPAIASNVRHLLHKVSFDARGDRFSVDKDEQLVTVLMMRVVG